MQVFCPYASPLETARCLDPKRLNKQIIECQQILEAIEGTGKGWFNHPVTKMYVPHRRWLKYYMKCLESFKDIKDNNLGNDPCALAVYFTWDEIASTMTPPFLTEEFCIQHRRRLYTKDKEYYKQFAEYGESEENWYYVDGELRKYINGKRIE